MPQLHLDSMASVSSGFLLGLIVADARVTIATHSRRIPQPPNVTAAPFNSMDLGSDLAQTNASEGKCEWESWSEETKVELFDVHIIFDSSNLGIFSFLLFLEQQLKMFRRT